MLVEEFLCGLLPLMKKIFLKDYIIEKYGKALYRVPVDLPLSCPHRINGGGKGCTFCPEDGARARHLRNNLDLKTQVKEGIDYVARRYGNDCGYIAYFQSFTNTNAPVEELKKYYSEVLESADFAMVIISTRPDCLPNDVLDYLEELNSKYDLWIELGVQSANDKTLELINRQHNFKCVEEAVAKLANRNIKIAAHVILGLPGEGSCEFRKTAEEIAKLPFSAIKIHNLLVLKGTPLAAEYEKQRARSMGHGKKKENRGPRSEVRGTKVNPILQHPVRRSSTNEDGSTTPLLHSLNEYEYADALIDFLTYIPDEWPLMRITADADPDDIIAPKWWMKKGQFIEYIRERLENPAKTAEKMPVVKTEDGSFTLYQPEYRQHFHSLAGAESEAQKKFIDPCEIRNLLSSGRNIRILDVGFGLGYNAISVANLANEIGKGKVEIISLEKDIKAVEAALAVAKSSLRSPSANSEGEARLILQPLLGTNKWQSEFASIKLVLGDARETINRVERPVDAVFLDPFSHEANPELWTYDFIKLISAKLADDAVIVTYSNAFPVRGAMIRCGLSVGETPAFGRKKGGTIASFCNEKITTALREKDLNIILKSTAGIPYRDPGLNNERDYVINKRKELMKRLQEKGVPKWFK